jgi:hypothetical protein
MYDIFDLLIHQFQIAVQEDSRRLGREDFNDFFQSCFTQLPYAISTAENQHIADKIIIRMTGILPITKGNFDLTSQFTTNFAAALIDDIKEHYDHLFSTITLNEWPLFRDGLTLYICIDLLSKPKDTITIVHRVKNEECKKDLANILLQRLEDLHRPILGLNWTGLFTLVDPNILTLQQLGLTESIQTYVTSLVQIVGMNIKEMDLSDKIIRHFDQLIFEDRLPGKSISHLISHFLIFLFQLILKISHFY